MPEEVYSRMRPGASFIALLSTGNEAAQSCTNHLAASKLKLWTPTCRKWLCAECVAAEVVHVHVHVVHEIL